MVTFLINVSITENQNRNRLLDHKYASQIEKDDSLQAKSYLHNQKEC